MNGKPDWTGCVQVKGKDWREAKATNNPTSTLKILAKAMFKHRYCKLSVRFAKLKFARRWEVPGAVLTFEPYGRV